MHGSNRDSIYVHAIVHSPVGVVVGTAVVGIAVAGFVVVVAVAAEPIRMQAGSVERRVRGEINNK